MQYPEQAPEWFSESHYIEQKVRECSLMNFQGNSSWTAEQVLAEQPGRRPSYSRPLRMQACPHGNTTQPGASLKA